MKFAIDIRHGKFLSQVINCFSVSGYQSKNDCGFSTNRQPRTQIELCQKPIEVNFRSNFFINFVDLLLTMDSLMTFC